MVTRFHSPRTSPSVREVVRRLEMISHFRRAGRRDALAYSTERRAAVLRKLGPPHAVPLRQLAQDEGISEATLHTWRREARSQGRLLPDTDAGPEGWSSRDKFAAVLETAALNEADLAAYCRRRGLYAEQVQAWRAACEQANDWERVSTQRLGQATREEKRRIQVLGRDLARKGSGHWPERPGRGGGAAGAAKKRRGGLGRRRGRMISTPDRRNALALIDQAAAAGARRAQACAELGLDERTCRRWRARDGAPEDRRPTAPRPTPRNKLSEEERKAVLDACNSQAFESLPPSQIVPRLADQGRYLAPEASFYRILRAEGQQHHRGRARSPPTADRRPAIGPAAPARSG